MSFYIITTLLPSQMECLWLLAWKWLANKATHGRIQQQEKHGLTWDAKQYKYLSKKGKGRWNSLNHNLELLVQILQGEFFFFSRNYSGWHFRQFRKMKSQLKPTSAGDFYLWYFRITFQRANGWQIGSVQMYVHAVYTYEGPLVLKLRI